MCMDFRGCDRWEGRLTKANFGNDSIETFGFLRKEKKCYSKDIFVIFVTTSKKKNYVFFVLKCIKSEKEINLCQGQFK